MLHIFEPPNLVLNSLQDFALKTLSDLQENLLQEIPLI